MLQLPKVEYAPLCNAGCDGSWMDGLLLRAASVGKITCSAGVCHFARVGIGAGRVGNQHTCVILVFCAECGARFVRENSGKSLFKTKTG